MTKEEFIARVDNIETFTSDEIAGIWWRDCGFFEYKEVDYVKGEDRRWSRFDEKIIEVYGRHFSIGCDVDLTECQEDEFSTEVIEVYPVEKQIVVTEWVRKV